MMVDSIRPIQPGSLLMGFVAIIHRMARMPAAGGTRLGPLLLVVAAWACLGSETSAQCCQNTTWSQVSLAGPSARYEHAMAYDPVRAKTVLFGGFDTARRGDTWEFDGVTSSWVIASNSGPSPRARHDMAYDAARGYTLLFGGHDGAPRDDTWTWNGTAWTQLAVTGPSARYGHKIAYDAVRQRIVLFGGRSPSFSLLGDTWEWNGTAWTQTATTGPSARETCAMTFDPTRGKVVIHGGFSGSTHEDDTWEWNGTAWSLVAANGPGRRSYHSMAPDPMCSRVILFGGSGMGPTGTITWALTGNTWTQVATTGLTRRDEFSMVYDSNRNRVVCFGGFGNSTVERLQDTWEFVHGACCCCPDGTSKTPTTHLFGINGTMGATPRTWRISFPGGAKCIELDGEVNLPPNSSAGTFARHLAGGINQVAAASNPGIVLAGWAPGNGATAEAYVFIRVFGCAAGATCPMELCMEPGTAMECCVPSDDTCIGTPTLERLPLSGDDCNANLLDDSIDFLIGVLTDENKNAVYDQCEGYCITAPLGFRYTTVGEAAVTCGADNGITLGPGIGGINMIASGFDSFGFEFETDTSVQAPIGVTLLSHGVLGSNPNTIRGIVAFEATSFDPLRFSAFADYGPAGATSMIVRLLNEGGELLASETFVNNPATPLISFGVPPSEIEIDRRIVVGTEIERRAGVFRFADPVTVTLAGDDYKGVDRVEFIAGGNIAAFGPLEEVRFQKRTSPVTIFGQYFRMPDGARWRPDDRTEMSVPEGSSQVCAGGSTGADRLLKAWKVESDRDKATSRVRLELDRERSVVEGAELSIRFIAIPDTPAPPDPPEEEVDPLDFSVVTTGGGRLMVSADLPLCLPFAGSGGVSGQDSPVLGPPEPEPDCGSPFVVTAKVCAGSESDPCTTGQMFSVTTMHVGLISVFPSTISEGIDEHALLCATYIFRAPGSGGPIDYDFSASGGPSGIAMDALSITFTGIPAPSTTYADIKSIRATLTVDGTVKSDGVSARGPAGSGCGDYNGDLLTNSQDFFDFLADFFSIDDQADFNLDGSINSQDFFDFLACFFA